jgi:cyclohexanecarboxyl-CoA dehydrogenase
MESSMAKWFSINEVAVPAIHDALLIHGQYGYSEEYNIVGRLKDVLGLEIGDGTADIQKLVIARELIGEESLPYR